MTGASPRAGASRPAGRTIELDAPAKANLGLRVTAVRDDGYHELDSLFVPLSLADRVRLELSAGAGVTLDLTEPAAAGVPRDRRNLAVRAAEAFLARAGVREGVRIELAKRIPAAAGLGGGSSDAGAVLCGLAALLPGAVAPAALRGLALDLGADVPFFLDPRPARVAGIGECIEPVPGLPTLWLVLANPGVALSTAEVFAEYDRRAAALTPDEAGSTMRSLSGSADPRGGSRSPGAPPETSSLEALPVAAFLAEALLADGTGGAVLLENHLEPSAVALCPEIAELRARLTGVGAIAAGMSGSGATVFGVFDDEAAARRALAEAAFEPPVWAEVVHTTDSRRDRGP